MTKGIAATEKNLTAKKGAIHIKKGKTKYDKFSFVNLKNVNCAILFS